MPPSTSTKSFVFVVCFIALSLCPDLTRVPCAPRVCRSRPGEPVSLPGRLRGGAPCPCPRRHACGRHIRCELLERSGSSMCTAWQQWPKQPHAHRAPRCSAFCVSCGAGSSTSCCPMMHCTALNRTWFFCETVLLGAGGNA